MTAADNGEAGLLSAPLLGQGVMARRSPRMDAAEAALVARSRAGDREAFEQLVVLHADRLYAVMMRLTDSREDAEEAVQEAFLRAWRAIGRFRGRSSFFTWLYRIAVNESKRLADRRRTRPRTVSLEAQPVEEAPDWSRAPEQEQQGQELAGVLEAAIRALPLMYREPVVLRDIEGLSTREAADALELSEAALRSRLHRARLVVRRRIDEYYAGGGRA